MICAIVILSILLISCTWLLLKLGNDWDDERKRAVTDRKIITMYQEKVDTLERENTKLLSENLGYRNYDQRKP